MYCSVLVPAAVLGAVLSLQAQQTSKPPPQRQSAATAPGMTNADVIKLAKAGFSEELIIGSIRESKKRSFRLDADSMVELKNGGVSERVIRAMLSPDEAPRALPVAAPPAPEPAKPSPSIPVVTGSTASDTAVPAELRTAAPGIYFAKDGSSKHLVALEPTVFSQGKTSMFKTMVTYGIAKSKWRAIVSGARAHQRIPPGQVTFYFIFEQRSSGPGGTSGFAGWLAAATSPNEFILAEMDRKSGGRELVVGESNLYTTSTGTRAEDVVPVEIEKIAPGIYRVKTAESLAGGEFCFFYAAGVSAFTPGMTGKLFDFGVDPKGAAVPKEH